LVDCRRKKTAITRIAQMEQATTPYSTAVAPRSLVNGSRERSHVQVPFVAK